MQAFAAQLWNKESDLLSLPLQHLSAVGLSKYDSSQPLFLNH